ncbi:dephospho-CoA kinase [bacterium]|nr:dephospho-CoA kinase [bacterium]
MLSIGLTGGIGAGKTTIAKLFKKLGATVMEADQAVHDLLNPGTPVWRDIISIFGPSILLPGKNEINLCCLSGLVFREYKALKPLLDIIYPRLKEALNRQKAMASREGARIFLFDGSQILEAGWDDLFDIIVLVMTGVDISKKRLSHKDGLSMGQICLRMGFQWPEWVKMRYADFFIDNNGPISKTERTVEFVYGQLVEISKAKKYQFVG